MGVRGARLLGAVLVVLLVQPAVTTASPLPQWQRWRAPAAMISNLGVYRSGEFVYQDYVYDDHGPDTDGINRRDLPFGAWPSPMDPTDPRFSPTGGSVRYAGDYMYATGEGNHYYNVADLVEWRVAVDAHFVQYRFVLGALRDPVETVIGVCVDEDGDASNGLEEWPFGAGLDQQLGCDHFLTLHGGGGAVTTADGTTTDLAAEGGGVRFDVEANTIDARVPRTVADPSEASWRYFVGAGLWDADSQEWVEPAAGTQRAENSPQPTGGGDQTAPNIWDLLSNNDEPNSYWREERQADELKAGDISKHFLDVDFGRVASREYEPDPQLTGTLSRIYSSRHLMDPPEGVTPGRSIGTLNFTYHGRYQPYVAVIPSNYYDDPGRAYPFDLCMHPLNSNHMVEVYYTQAFARDDYNPLVTGTVDQTSYLGFDEFEKVVDSLGTVYACVLGRGEGVGYVGGDGMVDVLEVQRDMHGWYRIDPDRRTVHGISLGAIGTWHMAPLYPDSYAAAMPYIFSPAVIGGADEPRLRNLYNLPVFFAIGTFDEFGQGTQGDPTADFLEENGNEYVYLHYLGRQHEGRIENDVLPWMRHLAYPRVRVRNPARVRYLFDPSAFSEKEPADGSAYWVRGMAPREDGSAEIDVVSLARAEELPTDQVVIDGLYSLPEKNYQLRARGLLRMTPEEFEEYWHPEQWEEGWVELHLDVTHTELPREARSNGFRWTSSNLGAVTLDASRMALDTTQTITAPVAGDGVTELRLLGAFAPGTTAQLDGEPIGLTRDAAGITIGLALDGEHQLLIQPGGGGGSTGSGTTGTAGSTGASGTATGSATGTSSGAGGAPTSGGPAHPSTGGGAGGLAVLGLGAALLLVRRRRRAVPGGERRVT